MRKWNPPTRFLSDRGSVMVIWVADKEADKGRHSI